MSAHGRPSPLVMHVHEIGMIVEVWREGVGWWAATARGRSRRGYFTPEAALRALTGSWPHEPWLARVGAAARHRAGSAHEAAAGKRHARRHSPGTVVAIRKSGPNQAHSATANPRSATVDDPQSPVWPAQSRAPATRSAARPSSS